MLRLINPRYTAQTLAMSVLRSEFVIYLMTMEMGLFKASDLTFC
jgi:hypothetical protein